VLLVRFFDPPFTSIIISETNLFNKKYSQVWTQIEDYGKNVLIAVISTEDARFCSHIGFDWLEIHKVIYKKEKRGASTITQQVAKNLFLWPGRSWSRKILEAYFAILIEILVPKKRILEIYINIVETGKLRFGIGSLSHTYFSKSVDQLSKDDALRIALILPNPKKRNPFNLNANQLKRMANLKKDMVFLEKDGRSSCFYKK
jgi:monofunctional biosynthetic peptidoglycan transglycosylase